MKRQRTCPVPEVLATLAFIFLTVSLRRHDWLGSAIFALAPFVPPRHVGTLFKRSLAALPFVLCAGAANCFYDRTPIDILGRATIPGGYVTLFALTARTFAAVGMLTRLTTIQGTSAVCDALRALRLPAILVLQVQLTSRYIGIIGEEARACHNAYMLRNPRHRVIPVADWGMLMGRLFLRCVRRAENIHSAMQCRLFASPGMKSILPSPGAAQWLRAIIFTAAFAALRAAL